MFSQFGNYLLRSAGISNKEAPYHVKWVSDCYRFLNVSNENRITTEQKALFLKHISRNREDWQVIQADQALNAILFVYRHVFEKDIETLAGAVRARPKRRLPVVLSVEEVKKILEHMTGVYKFMASLIYGCGLRLSECIRLRIKDIDLEKSMVIVRCGKGDKDPDHDDLYACGKGKCAWRAQPAGCDVSCTRKGRVARRMVPCKR